MEIEYTQVQIDKKLRDWLAENGKKNETFDDIIKRKCGIKVKKEESK